MIKFFRTIRQTLIMENKTSKYLKYAIGEIILVVIGILIALQINNWNEAKKTNRNVNNYLIELNSEIGRNLSYLSNINDLLKLNMKLTHDYLGKLNTATPETIQDTLLNNLINRIGPINWTALASSTLDDFNSSGFINAIKDDKLKKNIFRIQSLINEFEKRNEEIKDNWKNHFSFYYTKNGNLITMRDSIMGYALPKTSNQHNRSAFINNKEFNNLLVSRMMMSARSVSSLDHIINEIKNISNQISDYTQKHDKVL